VTPAELGTIEPLLNLLADKVAERVAARLGPPAPAATEDRLLTAKEAAEILGVTERWVYRRARSLPFARQLSKGVLRFSDAGIRAYVSGTGTKRAR